MTLSRHAIAFLIHGLTKSNTYIVHAWFLICACKTLPCAEDEKIAIIRLQSL